MQFSDIKCLAIQDQRYIKSVRFAFQLIDCWFQDITLSSSSTAREARVTGL